MPQEENEISLVDQMLQDEEGKQTIEMLLQHQMSQMSIIEQNPVADKISEEHISDYLAGSKENMKLSYEDKKQTRNFMLIVMLMGLLSLIIVVFILKQMPETLDKVITAVISGLSGALGGYGIGKKQQ